MKFGIILMVIMSASSAFATEDGWETTLTFYRAASQVSGNTIGNSTGVQLGDDFKVGYHWSGFYTGVVYSTYSITSTAAGVTVVTDNRPAPGITIGYRNSGFVADLSYFFSTTDTRPVLNLTGGTGIGVDLGYNFMLSSSFFMGFELSYKNFSFSTVTDPTGVIGVITETNVVTQTYPQITLGFSF